MSYTDEDMRNILANVQSYLSNNGMQFKNMVVSEACKAERPYVFSAKASADAPDPAEEVQMLMPLGGAESGLYRSPKVGESVMVMEDGTGASRIRYFMGYLPGNSAHNAFDRSGVTTSTDAPDPVSPKMGELINESAEVFRFKQTGKTAGNEKDERYSEIGFYQKKTAWKTTDAEKKNYGVFDEGYPKIDRLNIHSTGDIHQSAVNHQRTSAKRFELLVDCETDGSPSEYDEKKPFGDRSGDDSTLYAGDAHIRAKNRIVIKAGDSIELQAGRSSIIINDEGVIIASRKTQSNIYNAWDTLIALKASRGITMFGQHVAIRGGVDCSLSEGYGGSISSKLGIVRLNGFDIRAETLNTFNYLMRGIGNGVDFLANVGTMVAGAAGANHSVGTMTNLISTNPALPFLSDKGSTASFGGADFDGVIVGVLDTLLSILMVVEIVLNMAIPKVHKQDNHGRDGLYTALALVEYGLLLGAFYELCTPSMPYAIFEASLHLTAKAEMKMEAAEIVETCRVKTRGNSPFGGLSGKTAKEAYKDGWGRFKDKLVDKLKEKTAGLSKAKIGGIIAGGVAVVGAVGTGLGFGLAESGSQNADLEAQLRSL